MEKSEKAKNHIQKIKKKLEQTPENPLRSPKKSKETLITPKSVSSNPSISKNNKDFDRVPPSRFYTEKKEAILRFCQTSKTFFKNLERRSLSLGSKYEIIAGERRFRVAGQVVLKEIPAIIMDVANKDIRIISFIGNIQRRCLYLG